MPLRTYSRRALKRRFTTPPKLVEDSVEDNMSRRTQSFTTIAPESDDRTKRPFEHQTPNSGRKRMRLSAPVTDGKKTTELFLEYLSSSSILAQKLQQQDAQSEEVVLVQASQDHDVAPDDNRPVNEQPNAFVKADEDGLQTYEQHEGTAVEEEQPEDESAEGSEDSENQDGKSIRLPRTTKYWLMPLPGSLNAGLGFEDTAIAPSFKSSVKRYTLFSLSPPSDQKLQAKGRFLTPAKYSPPAGFKKIRRVRSRLGMMNTDHLYADNPFKVTKPTGDSPFKVAKHISDGFTSDEAHPSPHKRRERRTKSTLSEVQPKHLELTQKGAATQKLDGPTWARGQKRARPAPIAKRQYFGSSQFQIESEDPLESFEIKEPRTEPGSSRDRSKRLVSQICDDDDEPNDFLTYPDELDEHSSQADSNGNVDILTVPKKLNKRLRRLSSDDEPVDLLEVSDGDEELDLLTIPRTDTPEPHMKDASSESRLSPWGGSNSDGLLPAKRMLNVQDYSRDDLTLRPDSREWLRGVRRVSETPPWKDAAGP